MMALWPRPPHPCPAACPPRWPQEWWNATTVGEYWRLWNQPVHKWMLRHVYFPLIRHRVPKFYAGGGPAACALYCSRGLPAGCQCAARLGIGTGPVNGRCPARPW